MSETSPATNHGEYLIGRTVYVIERKEQSDEGLVAIRESSVVGADEGTDVNELWYSGVIDGVKPVPISEPANAQLAITDENSHSATLQFEDGNNISGTIEKISNFMDGPSTDVGGTTEWEVFVPES